MVDIYNPYMTTITDMPNEIGCHILSYMVQCYWGFFGQTCSKLRDMTLCTRLIKQKYSNNNNHNDKWTII